MQGVGVCKNGFSFLVVNGIDGSVTGISKTCTFTLQDKQRIQALKSWWESEQINKMKINKNSIDNIDASNNTKVYQPFAHYQNDARPNTYLRTIDQLEPNIFCDLICQVVSIIVVDSPTNKRIRLYVWDGTGRQQQQQSVQLQPVLSQSSAYSSISPFGILVPVIVWNNELFSLFNSGTDAAITEGSWIKFKGLQSKMYNEILELKMASNSHMLLLSEMDPQVIALKK